MTVLHGVSWDHERGLSPLRASERSYPLLVPDIELEWSARSLLGFGEDDMGELTRRNDLVILDHPFIGEAARRKLVVPLDDLLNTAQIEHLATNSVGPSYESYEWDSSLWALPVDAAAQVASWRPDLMDQAGCSVPTTWDEVLATATRLRAAGLSMALSMIHTDLVPTFLSISASLGDPVALEADRPAVSDATYARVFETILALRDHAHPMSLTTNPIGVYEAMTTTDEVAYCPLGFGYSNYARPGFRPARLAWGGIPGFPDLQPHATLGGAGIAVSAQSEHPEAAAQYAFFIASESYQAGEYFAAKGQPAHRSAWTSEVTNLASGNFFADTLDALDNAYLRPRFDGYLHFQDSIGPLLHQFVTEEIDAATLQSGIDEAAHTSARLRTAGSAGVPLD